MSNLSQELKLSNYHRNICEYGGVFGILLSATCLIQHFVVAIPGKITNPMIAVYILAICAFLLLSLMKSISMVFMIASGLLTMVVEWRWATSFAFSMVVLLLFIYHVIMIVLLYTEELPKKLKAIEKAKKNEEMYWQEKL